MKLVYTHPGSIMVAQARSALELANIDCVMRNEYAAGAIGVLAPIDTWPELWVLRDRDYERARGLLEGLDTESTGAEWQCANCGNSSPSTFELCWHCAGEKGEQRL